MDLNEKYEKIINVYNEIFERVPDGREAPVVGGAILRQVMELHQKIDSLEDQIKEIKEILK